MSNQQSNSVVDQFARRRTGRIMGAGGDRRSSNTAIVHSIFTTPITPSTIEQKLESTQLSSSPSSLKASFGHAATEEPMVHSNRISLTLNVQPKPELDLSSSLSALPPTTAATTNSNIAAISTTSSVKKGRFEVFDLPFSTPISVLDRQDSATSTESLKISAHNDGHVRMTTPSAIKSHSRFHHRRATPPPITVEWSSPQASSKRVQQQRLNSKLSSNTTIEPTPTSVTSTSTQMNAVARLEAHAMQVRVRQKQQHQHNMKQYSQNGSGIGIQFQSQLPRSLTQVHNPVHDVAAACPTTRLSTHRRSSYVPDMGVSTAAAVNTTTTILEPSLNTRIIANAATNDSTPHSTRIGRFQVTDFHEDDRVGKEQRQQSSIMLSQESSTGLNASSMTSLIDWDSPAATPSSSNRRSDLLGQLPSVVAAAKTMNPNNCPSAEWKRELTALVMQHPIEALDVVSDIWLNLIRQRDQLKAEVGRLRYALREARFVKPNAHRGGGAAPACSGVPNNRRIRRANTLQDSIVQLNSTHNSSYRHEENCDDSNNNIDDCSNSNSNDVTDDDNDDNDENQSDRMRDNQGESEEQSSVRGPS